MRDYRSSKSADQSTDTKRSIDDEEEGYDRAAVQSRSLGLLNREVQRLAAGSAAAKDEAAVQETAAAGVAGPGTELPHRDRIQAAFGPHDVSHVRAHVGGDAAQAAGAIGAKAYATGNDVAFADAPDVHTAAHEAAHVVQQRQGVHLKGGVGAEGDAYEQQADAVADAVVQGRSAAPLFGSDGVAGGLRSGGVQMIPMPAGAVAVAGEADRRADAAADRERAERLENEPEATKRQRLFLVENIERQLSSVFDSQLIGATAAKDHLGNAKLAKEKSGFEKLIAMAAGSSVAGTIGATSAAVAKWLSGRAIAGLGEKLATDGLKEAIKGALHAGASAQTSADGDALASFAKHHALKLQLAKSEFQNSFWNAQAERFYKLELSELQAMSDELATRAQTAPYADAQERSFVVEWTNLIAQSHHGAMQFDPWQGEDGAPGRALKTSHTRLGDEDGREDNEHGEAAVGNVKASGVADLLDDDQRTLEDEHHGILEVHLWIDDDGISTYTRHANGGLRMDNVPAYVRRKLSELGTVADAHVNKIVRVFQYLGSEEINPRPPAANIFVSADGFVRSWASGLNGTKFKGESRIQELVEFAESLPIKDLGG